ncbi:MAG: hypothetical protein GY768_19875 [Planctomycetaceae bacterium]|nr:hypothetical protein [Planctomycetaceae bacterium]
MSTHAFECSDEPLDKGSHDPFQQVAEEDTEAASNLTEQATESEQPIPGWILGVVTVLVCLMRLIYT